MEYYCEEKLYNKIVQQKNPKHLHLWVDSSLPSTSKNAKLNVPKKLSVHLVEECAVL